MCTYFSKWSLIPYLVNAWYTAHSPNDHSRNDHSRNNRSPNNRSQNDRSPNNRSLNDRSPNDQSLNDHSPEAIILRMTILQRRPFSEQPISGRPNLCCKGHLKGTLSRMYRIRRLFGEWSSKKWSHSENGRILAVLRIGRLEIGHSENGRLENGRSENGCSENGRWKIGRSENCRSENGWCI
jgi:hypothetical protein